MSYIKIFLKKEEKNMARNYEDEYFEEEIVEETPRKTGKGKLVKILLLVLGIPALLTVGLVIGIFFTQKSFDDDRELIATLQEEASSFEEQSSTAEQELANVIARAEEAEEKLAQEQERANELKTINDSLEERIENLKASLETASETQSGLEEEYINWKFWSDGNRYQATGENVFYSDPECKNELENEDVVLISPVVSPDKIKDDSGEIITVYTSRSENGFVYSREIPNINPIE